LSLIRRPPVARVLRVVGGRKEINMKTVSYLRVSTSDQDTAKNRAAVLEFAARMGFGKPRFTEEKVSGRVHWSKRKLGALIDGLKPGDVLITPELSRLGRSLIGVLEVLNEAKARGARVFSVKEGFQLNGDDMQSKIMSTLLALFADVERDLLVARVREGVHAARVKRGGVWGRPRGSRLDPFKKEIVEAYRGGATLAELGRRYGCAPGNVGVFLRQRGVRTRVHGWR